jgi:hypothetical protein
MRLTVKNTLTQKLRLLAIVEDEATNEFLAKIEFRDIYGRVRSVHTKRSDLDDLRD